jgi:hypothetical protein
MSGEIVPFGKYKGQSVEALAADRDYCDWLLAQPWAKDKLRSVYNIIINYGAEPQDTPEHNALQLQFLDEAVRMRLWRVACPGHAQRAMKAPAMLPIRAAEGVRKLYGDAVSKARAEIADWERRLTTREERVAKLEADPGAAIKLAWPGSAYMAGPHARKELDEARKQIERLRSRLSELTLQPSLAFGRKGEMTYSPPKASKPVFEDGGWDVTFHVKWQGCAVHHYRFGEFLGPLEREICAHDQGEARIAIECKPTIGDDFPSVLRQVKNHKGDFTHRIVMVGSYTGQGGTFEQVKEMFSASGFKLVMLGEILA